MLVLITSQFSSWQNNTLSVLIKEQEVTLDGTRSSVTDAGRTISGMTSAAVRLLLTHRSQVIGLRLASSNPRLVKKWSGQNRIRQTACYGPANNGSFTHCYFNLERSNFHFSHYFARVSAPILPLSLSPPLSFLPSLPPSSPLPLSSSLPS